MNITTIASTTNPACYTYAFDTSSTLASHSMVPLNPVQESIDKKVMDVYSVPNPNNGQASIYFSLGEAMQGELIIMDIYGKVVDRISLNSETNKIDVNYSEFANGIYMMSVRNSNGEVINKKMIISK